MNQENNVPRLIYVEDDQIGREVVAMFLKDKYSVDLVDNYDEVVYMISRMNYSAILLDMNLGKGVSGIDIVKEIRKLPKYDKVPIIAVTAYAMREDQNKILNSGFTHYISKPFTRKSLLTLLEDALS